MVSRYQQEWAEEWEKTGATLAQPDAWLLTDHIKLNYLAGRVPAGASVLEVGCGSAKLSALLAARGARVTGLDMLPAALAAARQNFDYMQAPGNLLQADAFHLPFAENQFDVVLSTGLLEHFADPTPVLREMKRVLRRGGLLFSDIAPLKFSLLRLTFFLRGHQRRARAEEEEFACSIPEVYGWLEQVGFAQARVFSSGVVPPSGVVRRSGLIRRLSFRFEKLWTVLDGTWVSDWLGFFYLLFATKP